MERTVASGWDGVSGGLGLSVEIVYGQRCAEGVMR